ncbi:hypothetical protein B0H13DRAFT_1535541, partial [Mycena leptocephala]
EITSKIFLLCLPDISLASQEIFYPGYRAMTPIVLSGVCRQWRDIALTTPRLWSTIIISLDHIASAVISHSRAEIFMEQWLNRAAVLPLTMVL